MHLPFYFVIAMISVVFQSQTMWYRGGYISNPQILIDHSTVTNQVDIYNVYFILQDMMRCSGYFFFITLIYGVSKITTGIFNVVLDKPLITLSF
jgi:hypothetical protein